MRRVGATPWVLACALAAGTFGTASAAELGFSPMTVTVEQAPPFPVKGVIQSDNDFRRFLGLAPNAVVPSVDYQDYTVVGIHLGSEGSSHYSVQISSIERLETPRPTLIVRYTVLNTPYTGNSAAPVSVVRFERQAGVRLQFVEDGGEERLGFNTISRSLQGQENLAVRITATGRITIRHGQGETTTRALMAEMDVLSAAVRQANLASIPDRIPSEEWGRTRFAFLMYGADRERKVVEGGVGYEGDFHDRLAPLNEAFDLILARLGNRSMPIRGVVSISEGRVHVVGALDYTLDGPISGQVADFEGRHVELRANVTLQSPTEADANVTSVVYPRRAQLEGHVRTNTDRSAVGLVPTPPMPDTPITASGRAEALLGQALGRIVVVDGYVFFNEERLPSEIAIEAIQATFKAGREDWEYSLRDRPSTQSLPNGTAAPRQTVWVSTVENDYAFVVAGQTTGWVPVDVLAFGLTPERWSEVNATRGMSDLLEDEDN